MSNEPVPCASLNRTRAFARAIAICQGHSVLCVQAGLSATCPITTGVPGGATPLRHALQTMNDALDRGRLEDERKASRG